jgi:4-amino-4-deoxy-L-arabinose transferase-like glycosyltransferase
VPFCLGKYFELNSPDPFDSGAYVYSAHRVLSGARIGYDEVISAQIGTLLVNMLGVRLFGYSEIGPKLLQAVFQATAFVLMFVVLARLYGRPAAGLAVVVASVYLSAPLLAKYGNVKEQYMIALAIVGMSLLVLHHLANRKWYAILAGAMFIFGPMFKQTGVSAIAAVGLFVLVQPILKHGTWKQTGKTILLLAAGATIGAAPIYTWLVIAKVPTHYWSYSFVFKPIVNLISGGSASLTTGGSQTQDTAGTQSAPDKPAGDAQPKKRGILSKLLPPYVTDSWAILGPAERKETAARVLRYYLFLILPISLAVCSIVLKAVRLMRSRINTASRKSDSPGERFVLLFGLWWLLDMAFVWISPHSYEQYYLPLNASAAMLGAYCISVYQRNARAATGKNKWVVVAVIAALVMLAMSWQIFFGIVKSPHSGSAYRNPVTGTAERQRGYAQKWSEVHRRRVNNERGAWEHIGQYIRAHSTELDTIYVWGWFPGIYVNAQRISAAPKSCEGMMHTLPASVLATEVEEVLTAFNKSATGGPKFIVDSLKRHFPWNRPPFELWPRTDKGFLPLDKNLIDQYDSAYAKLLAEKIEPEEAKRFEAMRPFRQYVMNNYTIVGGFDPHVLFMRK